LLENLKKWHSECPLQLLVDLANYLKPFADHFGQNAQHEVFAQENQLRDKLKQFRDKFDVLYLNILLANKALASVTGSLKSKLDKFLLDTLCNDLVKHVLEYEAMQNYIQVKQITTIDDTTQVLKQLPQQVSTALNSLLKTLQRNTDEFLLELSKNTAKQCDLFLKTLDNKTSRTLLFNHRMQSLQQLASETNPISAFHLVLLILYIKYCKSLLLVPSDALEILIKSIKPHITESIQNDLESFNDLVVKCKETQTETSKGGELQDQLKTKLENIKLLVNAELAKSSD